MAVHVEDAPATIVFSIFYIIFSLGFVYQSKEFVGAGITAENILTFRDWVGSEDIRFVQYHVRRTAGTLIIHSLIPLGYLTGYSYFTSLVDGNHPSMAEFWQHWPSFQLLLAVAVSLPLAIISLVWYWSLTDWECHPFVKRLRIYAGENWRGLSADLETEYRRIDKIRIETNPLVKVVVTDSWIILLGSWPWSLHISHQSDSSLDLVTSNNYQISREGELGGAQFLLIQVECRKPGVASFRFRLNSLEYQNLQDKLSGPIQNIQNIQIYKTVSERFVEVFKETIMQNPRVSVNEELEMCIGCMTVISNIKIKRVCDSSQGVGEGGEGVGDSSSLCVNCYCRPMWCLDCMGKWFASRQDQSRPETWLGSKCPCPTCRSKFCVLDVCLIE